MRNGFPNIRHMRVFIEVARTGSVSEAAARCHLSQPGTTGVVVQNIPRADQALIDGLPGVQVIEPEVLQPITL